jgi:C4-dicarboxylate-specific signal transduction histidine kinase
MLSSWYGGLWPGLFAALLSVVALDYYFIPPLYALGIGLEEVPDMIVFVATALFISWLNGNQKRAKESLRQAHDELDAKVRERTAELKRANEQLQSEIAERKTAEDGLIRAQGQIARIARITTMGELAASIAHELNQPLGSIVMSGDACLRWLAAKPPNLEEVRQAVEAIIRDGTRASSVLVRIRGLLRRGERLRERLDINDVVREVIFLFVGELRRNGVSLETDLHGNLPQVVIDRVLLQQVILNLIMNAIEAMRAIRDQTRVLRIRTEEQPSGNIVVLVQDSGAGVDPEYSSRVFEAFYTTKTEGIGMGLTISRSIIEAHGGRLWAVANGGPGSTFCFTLPIGQGSTM